MLAIQVSGNSLVQGNTIGSDRGIHGRFGIFVNSGNPRILDNRIGGFKTNVLLLGTTPEFRGNTFMGDLDLQSKEMNVRVGNGNATPENQNYPDYFEGNNWWGNNYGEYETEVDMRGNYWSNVDSDKIALSIWDFDDRIDLIGNVNFEDELTVPSSDAPISPPRNVIKLSHPNGVQFKWTPNDEKDLEGYKVYYGRNENGTFINSTEISENSSYVLVGGNVNNEYYLTAYDTIADGVDDQIEGHESWFAEPAASLNVSISSEEEVIAELEQFKSTKVTVELSSPSPEDITFNLITSGIADENVDYELSSSSVTIPYGSLRASVDVTAIIDNNDNEEDENIDISLSNNSLVSLGINSKVSITIASDICEFIPNSISGSIEEDLILYNICNPYYFTGNVIVRSGVTLTIEPGVTVVFSPQTYLSVNGTLIAEGTEEDSIIFTGSNWRDINIQNSNGGSSLSYVKITDNSPQMYDWKLRLNKSSISNSEIYNVKAGITMQDSSSVSFTTFRDIEGTSIEAWNSVIYGNEFYDLMSVDRQGERAINLYNSCLLYTSPSPRDRQKSRMPSSA